MLGVPKGSGNSDHAEQDNREQDNRYQEEDKDPGHLCYIGRSNGWLYRVSEGTRVEPVLGGGFQQLVFVMLMIMVVIWAPKGLFKPGDEPFQFRRRELIVRVKRTVIPQRHFSVANHARGLITVLIFATPLRNV